MGNELDEMKMEKRDRLNGMLMGAFTADAFALGPHWIYDLALLEKMYGRPEELTDPQPDSWHPNKQAGDFTHYGDQMLLLLKSLQQADAFHVDVYEKQWKTFMESYSGYKDRAMRTTYKNLKHGYKGMEAASDSSEFSAVGRIAPILYYYENKSAQAIEKAIEMATLTHNHTLVVEGIKFFSQLVFEILAGQSPTQGIKRLWKEMDKQNPIKNLIREGMDRIHLASPVMVQQVGAHCALENALPSTIQMIMKYEDDYRSAMIENVIAGGDSAARGMVLGMVLGAWNGPESIPKSWFEEIKAYDQIKEFLCSKTLAI